MFFFAIIDKLQIKLWKVYLKNDNQIVLITDELKANQPMPAIKLYGHNQAP